MIPTMLPSGGSVTGYNPNSGSNDFVDDAVNGEATSPQVLDPSKDALSQLYQLAQENPEYIETYLQLLAERENTTNAQAWYEKMSGSQYSRAYKDLESVGLNPALALMNLSGAGSGSVSASGSWTTSPYANKMSKESNDVNKTKTAISAISGFSTAILALLAMVA